MVQEAQVEKPPSSPAKSQRLVSLDAYRGAIMLLMASSGLGMVEVAKHYPDSRVWAFLARHTDHAAWVGCNFWDLIQPAFMFMVGMALPWSIANRQARGATFLNLFGHALWRSLALVLLAVFLTSNWSRETVWIFTNVLAQVGLGYPVLFLLAFTRPRTQWLAAGGILVGYWLLFALHPLPPTSFDWSSVGLKPDWPFLSGFAAHWEKNANFAATFDLWFLNLFPRETRFAFSSGGYQTLNFIPSLATMIFGLLAGQLMRSPLPVPQKTRRLVMFGLAGILLGLLCSLACPIVKRIWTPSWAIYSGGWVALMLAGFVAVIEWRGWKRWTLPLVVVGLNPITLYCLWQLSSAFIANTMKIHLGRDIFAAFGEPFAPMVQRAAILLVLWLIVYWMYRRKLFIRI